MVQNNIIGVELVYITPTQQTIIPLALPATSDIHSAIIQSGILQQHPEIDLEKNKVGIFNQLKPLTTPLKDGDRIEIYRPLLISPKAARRIRAREKTVTTS